MGLAKVGGGLISWWVNETHVCLKVKYILESAKYALALPYQ